MADDKGNFPLIVLVAIVAIVGLVVLVVSAGSKPRYVAATDVAGRALDLSQFGFGGGRGGGGSWSPPSGSFPTDPSMYSPGGFDPSQFGVGSGSFDPSQWTSHFPTGGQAGGGFNLQQYVTPIKECVEQQCTALIPSTTQIDVSNPQALRGQVQQVVNSLRGCARQCIVDNAPEPVRDIVNECNAIQDDREAARCVSDGIRSDIVEPAKACIQGCASSATPEEFEACAQQCVSGYIT